jgi:predicted CoA-binding protein
MKAGSGSLPNTKAAWSQSGIRNDAVAERLATAGIRVVQNRCLVIDHHGM